MLRDNFPNNNEEAQKYGGFMLYEKLFCKTFDFLGSPEKTLEIINKFLVNNGYEKVNKIDEEFSFENEYLSISKHGYLEELVLFIKKDIE